MSKHYKQKEITRLEGVFFNLISSSQICKGNQTFHAEDLLRLYIKRTSGLPQDRGGALNDIVFHFPKDFIDMSDESAQVNIRKLCRFFLLDTPVTLIDLSIRSMIRCLRINPFVMSHYSLYSDFIVDVKSARESLLLPSITKDEYSALFRAANMILMLNDDVFITENSKVARALTEYVDVNASNDLPLSTVYIQYACRYTLSGGDSLFSTSKGLHNKEFILRLLKALNHVANWKNNSETNREYILASLFISIAPSLRGDKEVILQSAHLYPTSQIFIPYSFSEYIAAPLRKDPEIATMLRLRQDSDHPPLFD